MSQGLSNAHPPPPLCNIPPKTKTEEKIIMSADRGTDQAAGGTTGMRRWWSGPSRRQTINDVVVRFSVGIRRD